MVGIVGYATRAAPSMTSFVSQVRRRRDARLRGHDKSGNCLKRLACVVALSVAGGTAALTAELPPPVAPPPSAPAAYIPVAPPYNWSGFYIGGNLGAGWSSPGSANDTFGSTFGTTTSTSFLGGGQVGVNYQFWSFFVIGAEAMFDWLPNTQNTVSVTNTTIVPGTTNTAAVTLNNRFWPSLDHRSTL